MTSNNHNIQSQTLQTPNPHVKGHQYFQKFASFFGKIYSTELNPLYYLGGMTVLLFTIACISGIYVFIFYNINPKDAWNSVEAMSNNYFNGWMRSMHRYSSDLLVVFTLLHLIHTLITSKFKRKLSWISGIISFLVVIIIGVTGFILVWDQKAKLAGYLTARLFSNMPIFDPSIAGAFLMNDLNTIGGFFKIAVFGHIVFSLVTLILIWVHIMRISKPKIFPPKKLIIYCCIAISIICLIFPVKSDLPAESSNLPTETTFDWYYFFGFYLMKVFSINVNWLIMIGSGLLLSFIPFYIKRKNRQPVEIDLDKCDGCNLCSYDCPYEAIDMLMVNDERKAILSPDKCVGCTICIGSCDEHAISHDDFPIYELGKSAQSDLTIFSCSYFPKTEFPQDINIHSYQVPCLGSVMAKDVQLMLENNSSKIAFLGCEDCYYRQGKTWAIHRFLRKRPPLLSRKYDASRLQLFTLTQYSKEKLIDFVKAPPAEDIRKSEMTVKDKLKNSPILSTLVLILFFALMIPLSSTVVHFFDPKEKTLIVNFKYVSSPMEWETSSSEAAHMQSKVPVVKKRSPVLLQIFSTDNNTLLFEKQFEPRGLRSDIAMFIYAQLNLEEDAVNVQFTETAFPNKKFEIKNVHLKQGDGSFVIFKNNQLVLGGSIEKPKNIQKE